MAGAVQLGNYGTAMQGHPRSQVGGRPSTRNGQRVFPAQRVTQGSDFVFLKTVGAMINPLFRLTCEACIWM